MCICAAHHALWHSVYQILCTCHCALTEQWQQPTVCLWLLLALLLQINCNPLCNTYGDLHYDGRGDNIQLQIHCTHRACEDRLLCTLAHHQARHPASHDQPIHPSVVCNIRFARILYRIWQLSTLHTDSGSCKSITLIAALAALHNDLHSRCSQSISNFCWAALPSSAC